jgi:hypothetical protein
MKEVKTAVAISDLHLGRDLGYLYSKNPKFQKNKEALLELLKNLGPQDELILNGDLLELSMVGLDEAYRELKEFFVLLSQCPGFKRIVYVPGNHDHHFWRELAELVCVNGRIGQGILPPGHLEYPTWFVDKSFSSSDRSLPCRIILAEIWPQEAPVVEIVVKYPHHLVKVLSGNGDGWHCLFTHGHFLEDMFTPVEFLIKSQRLDELEAFNNVWIEACDYYVGRSGRLFDTARDLVEKFERGDKEAKKEMSKVLNKVYENCANKLKLRWPKTTALKFAKYIIGLLIKEIPLEKKSGLFNAPVDDKLKEKITEYIEEYIVKRYRKGMAKTLNFPSDRDIPAPFTFVFGHTHRPLGTDARESVKVNGMVFPLANTGGWLRIDGTGAGNGENAGILLVNGTGAHWMSLNGKLK